MKKLTTLLILFNILISCSNDDQITLNDENTISRFRLNINGNTVDGNINQDNGEITFNTRGADLSSLIPEITYSGSARINPLSNIPRNFTNPINYIVTAENGDTKMYTVIVTNTPFSSEKSITKFSIVANGQEFLGNINENDKSISITIDDIDLNAITPVIEASEFATISPLNNGAQNFQNEISYNIIAEDGSSINYIVRVNWPKFNDDGFANNLFYYAGFKVIISGEFLNTNHGERLYLSDGSSNYDLSIDNSYLHSQGTNIYSHEFNIPDNVTTSIYKLYYQRGNTIIEHKSNFDIKAENIPVITSINQTSYNHNDIMIINGENLTPSIMIPSNGSLYLINAPSSTYNYTLSSDKKNIQLKLGNYQLFPSYYGNSSEVKSIVLIDDDGRRGPSFDVTFN